MELEESGASNESTAILRTPFVGLDGEPADTQCLLCDFTFILPTNEEQFLSHLFKEHRLVIGDVSKIASIRSYVNYWRVKFKETILTEFCTTLLMDCTPDGKLSKNEVYFLLSDCLSEERTLRDELHRSRLELGLAQQAYEREDMNFKRGCMFCKTEISGLRLHYLRHLSDKHNIQLGKPENLVFVDKLLDKIQNNIERPTNSRDICNLNCMNFDTYRLLPLRCRLTCIYCEKLFKDRTVLKEHMRKKLHKRINPHNKTYDRFYITNYLESDDNWHRKQKGLHEMKEPTAFTNENDDEENSWADWKEENVVTCLLCPHKNQEFSEILGHMKLEHNFDFEDRTKNLNFYGKIKVVNYLRRQSHEKKCIYCDTVCEDVPEHMKKKNHEKLPATSVWNQPEFYFPMYETDSFLYHLHSTSDDEDEEVINISNNVKKTSIKN